MYNMNDSNEMYIFSHLFNQTIKGKLDYIYKNSILINDFFDYEVCKTICEYVVKGSDVIDIGSNIGLVTLGVKRLLELNNSSNYINNFHCFECNDETFSYLKCNTINHNDIILYNFGLSDKSEIANMQINNYNYGCNMIKQIYDNSNNNINSLEYEYEMPNDNVKIEKKLFISLTSLDLFYNIFQNRVSVIKIDTEGMEYKILLGAKNLIEKHKPTIVVEIFDENLIKINELLKSYNYINKGIIPKKYKSQDYLFVYNY